MKSIDRQPRQMKTMSSLVFLLLIAFSIVVVKGDATSHLRIRRGLMDEDNNESNQATENEDEMEGDKDEELSDTEEDIMNGTTQQQQQGLVDLVHLVPFDVQIAVTINMGIQTYEVSNIVTEWINDAYREQLAIFGYTSENRYAEFNFVVLFNNENTSRQRQVQSTNNNNLFVAKFRGGAVFTRDETNTTVSIPDNDVLVIQQNILMNDTGLLLLLQQSTDATGLGEYVIDVNAFLNPSETPNTDVVASTSDNNSGLDVVIIVAIVIAIVAFLFLLGAIIWAYRFDRANRDAYLLSNSSGKDQNTTNQSYPKHHDHNNKNSNLNDKTTSETETSINDPDTPERVHRSIIIEGSPNSVNNTSIPNNNHHNYPMMIGGDNNNNNRKDLLPVDDENINENDDDEQYPESVISDSVVSGSAISEDISTSLSQYYRAGMGGKADYGRGNGMLSDAGSVSSMESYGYSLDGGMSMAIPTEIPYQSDRQRIGGLPIEPDAAMIATSASREGSIFDERSMDDVQILDLDKELSNLDIKLLPKYAHDDDDDNNDTKNETYSQEELEKYQLEDFKEMAHLSNSNGIPTIVSTTSSTSGSKASSNKTTSSKASSKKTVSSKASSKKSSSTTKNPIDTDSMMGAPTDDDDSLSDELLPKLPTDPIF